MRQQVRRCSCSPDAAARWGKTVRQRKPLEPLPSGPCQGTGEQPSFRPLFLERSGEDRDITFAKLQAALRSAHEVMSFTRGSDGLSRRHGHPNTKGPIPEREPESVVILDKLATHKSDAAAQMLKSFGCWFVPASSPDLNLIDMACPKLKAHLLCISASPFDLRIEPIGEICDLFTPNAYWNFRKASGYGSRINGNALASGHIASK